MVERKPSLARVGEYTGYRAFGWSIRSNRALPDLVSTGPCEKSDEVDLDIDFVGDVPVLKLDPPYRPLMTSGSAGGRALLRVHRLEDDSIRMKVDGVPGRPGQYFEFVIGTQGERIRIACPPDKPIKELLPFLYNAAFGIAMRLAGICCLHANVLEWNGQGLILLGPKGAGKSTLSDAMIQAGCRLVADDIAAIHWEAGMAKVQAGLAQLRLTERVARQQHGAGLKSARLWNHESADWNKRVVRVGADRFFDRAVPVATVLQLGARQEGISLPVTRRLLGTSALVALARHPFAPYVLTPGLRARNHADVSRLLDQVQILDISLPDDLSKLNEAATFLLAQDLTSPHTTAGGPGN